MHSFYVNAQLIAQRDSRHLAKAAMLLLTLWYWLSDYGLLLLLFPLALQRLALWELIFLNRAPKSEVKKPATLPAPQTPLRLGAATIDLCNPYSFTSLAAYWSLLSWICRKLAVLRMECIRRIVAARRCCVNRGIIGWTEATIGKFVFVRVFHLTLFKIGLGSMSSEHIEPKKKKKSAAKNELDLVADVRNILPTLTTFMVHCN
jgi:hypothetical protein